ncbi:hypothetical protein C4D60_Mb02t02510 [Musa balbisiana]|uniref:Uncharacterized protein n=1 Tax=Musa balbisiana TaxID=52838 RepID=A0A4S8I7S8_MUSBA|nr:hypothetical protein C4D60_Mb02t02510 [Musa balbisiana]
MPSTLCILVLLLLQLSNSFGCCRAWDCTYAPKGRNCRVQRCSRFDGDK